MKNFWLNFLLLVTGFFSQEVMAAEPVVIDGLKYRTMMNMANIIGTTSDLPENIVIPASVKIDGKEFRVSGINNALFKGKPIKSVVWKAPVGIPQSCFENCDKLEKVVIEKGCADINYYAFQNCVSLKEVSFPADLKTISKGAFTNSGLTEVTIPAGTKVGEKAFENCKELVEVNFLSGKTPTLQELFSSFPETPYYAVVSNGEIPEVTKGRRPNDVNPDDKKRMEIDSKSKTVKY